MDVIEIIIKGKRIKFDCDLVLARLLNHVETVDYDKLDYERDKMSLLHKITKHLYYIDFLSTTDAIDE